MIKIKYLASISAAFALAMTAHALPVGLTLSTNGGATTTFVAINAAGQATFNGSIGTWSINIDTGLAYPAVGSATHPILDLAFDAMGSGTGSTALTVDFVDQFGPVIAGVATATVGGTLTSGIGDTFEVLENGSAITAPLAFSSSPFSGTVFGATSGGATVTFDENLVVSGSGQTSGDFNVDVPDSGTTALLMALGLAGIGLGMVARNRKVTVA